MTEDKLVDKIRAILRKAEESSNQHKEERDTAMRMANRLLLKHGLTMQDIGDLEDPADREMEHEPFMEYDAEESWLANLLNKIAPIYFCKVYRLPRGDRTNRLMLIGRREHAATCRAMFEFIRPQLEGEFNLLAVRMDPEARTARKFAIIAAMQQGHDQAAINEMSLDELGEIGRAWFAEIKEQQGAAEAMLHLMAACGITSAGTARNVRAYVNQGKVAPHLTDNMGVYRRSFYAGAVTKVANRLRELMAEEVTDLGDSGTALVKNEMADLDAFMKSLGLGLRGASSSRVRRDRNAMNAGTAAGARADLSGHRKVAGNRKELGR